MTLKNIEIMLFAIKLLNILPYIHVDVMALLYKYYIPWEDDSRKYHPEECDYQARRSQGWYDNHISRDDIFDYQPFMECNIYFILNRTLDPLFSTVFSLRPTMVGKIMRNLLIYMHEWKYIFFNSLSARSNHDVRLNKLRHKKLMMSNLIPSSVI